MDIEKDLVHKYALLMLIETWESGIDKQGVAGALLKFHFYFIGDL